MKNQLVRVVLVATAAFLLNAGRTWATDNTPPTQETPGTAPAMDTKTQENNPAGPAMQKTASMSPGTKHHRRHHPKGTAPVANQAGMTDSKSPQDIKTPNVTSP